MKGITTIIIILIIVVGAILIYNSYENRHEGPSGEIVVTVTDAAADMENVSEITVTVDDITFYNENRGWVSTDTESKEYNLLELRNSNTLQLAAQTQVPADAYSRARITLDEVTVTTTEGATTQAAVPSNEITIDGTVTVAEESTTGVTFDFLADQSLHTTENGEFVFASVIEMQSQTGGTVSISDEDESVTITGGTVETNITVGTDIDGSTKADFQLNTDTGLELDAGGNVNLLGGNGEETDTDDSEDESNGADVEASSETNATIDDSEVDAEANVGGSLN